MTNERSDYKMLIYRNGSMDGYFLAEGTLAWCDEQARALVAATYLLDVTIELDGQRVRHYWHRMNGDIKCLDTR